jgi:hypothetical protein
MPVDPSEKLNKCLARAARTPQPILPGRDNCAILSCIGPRLPTATKPWTIRLNTSTVFARENLYRLSADHLRFNWRLLPASP